MTGQLTIEDENSGEHNLPIYGGHHFKETIYDILASMIGSAACVYTGQPFDTVKVRLQVNSQQYSGLIECFRKTIKGEGVRALWKGALPAFMGAVSENAVAFASNGLLKRLLHTPDEGGEKPFYEPFISGAITGMLSATVLCPCDIIKCRAQVNIARGLQQQSISALVSSIWQKKGLLGFYAGFHSQILRDIPFYCSFFGSYDILCHLLKKHTDLPETSIYFMAGGFAGQVGWVISIAPDTIKSRIQTSDNPMSIIQTTKSIISARGMRGLFAGIEVAIIRAFPANAALFVAYELSRKSFSNIL